MAEEEKGGGTLLTPEEMRAWHAEEIRDVLKECDLRVRDATQFTIAFLAGELTPEQANARLSRYEARWGDPLRGVLTSNHRSDEAIVEAIDKALRRRERLLTHLARASERGPSGPHR